jgi:hypothetical protein
LASSGALPYPPAMRCATLLGPFVLVAAGCDPDTAVFVEATISSPSADVEGGVLGGRVSGAFVLELHLGPRASEGSDVTIGAFDLMSQDQTVTLLSPLPTDAASQPSPIRVEVDSTVSVPITFDTGADTIPTETHDAICAAVNVVLAGSIEDSLEDGLTPVASSPFAVTGCP